MNSKQRSTSPLFYLSLMVVWLALDFALKTWSRNTLSTDIMRPFIPEVLSLTLAYNTGAAWGLFSGSTLPLALLRIAVGLGLVVYMFRSHPKPLSAVALSLVSARALGNGLENLVNGKVTDMLYSHQLSAITQVLNQGTFPIFNLADVWVVAGVLLLFLGSLQRRGRNDGAREGLDA
jgi:signal peptidase II